MMGDHGDPARRIDEQALEQFCRRHHVRRLTLYGSALREDFRSDSDLDVLVEFLPGATPGLLQLSRMELELGALLDGREVDLRTYEDLSHHLRDAVREQATTLYDAA